MYLRKITILQKTSSKRNTLDFDSTLRPYFEPRKDEHTVIYPKYSPDLARITRGLHAWKVWPSRQNLVVVVFVQVVAFILQNFEPQFSFALR